MSVLLVIAYVSLAVFAVTTLYRTAKIARLPVHLRWELSPVPHEKGKGRYGGSYFEEYEWWTKPRERSLVSEVVYMFQEIVFLKSVWEHNRRLWWLTFPFHFGIYLLIVAASLLLLGAILQWALGGGSGLAGLNAAVLAIAATGYGLGAFGTAGLLVARFADPRLSGYRTGAAVFNLGFLLVVFLSGGIALVASGGFPQKVTGFLQGLLTADSSVEVPGVLAAHLVLVFLFLAYLPFTQMLHFVAKYFTYHEVRWDDEAMEAGSRMERQVQELLKQPVTWSGRHLGADGIKDWQDIATGKVEE